jgi:hypothetical protein
VRINERTVLGASGELSDLQYILKCDPLPTCPSVYEPSSFGIDRLLFFRAIASF